MRQTHVIHVIVFLVLLCQSHCNSKCHHSVPEQQSDTFKKTCRIKKLVMEIAPVCAACSCSESVHVPFLSVWLTVA